MSAIHVANKITSSILEHQMMKTILLILDAESVSLPATGRGDAYDACQYLENLLGKESKVVAFMRSQLGAN